MQMFRKLLLVVCVGVFSIAESYAMEENGKEYRENLMNKKRKEESPSPHSPKKIKTITDDVIIIKTPEKPKNKEGEMIPVFSPLLKDTPTKVESKFWAPFRTELA